MRNRSKDMFGHFESAKHNSQAEKKPKSYIGYKARKDSVVDSNNSVRVRVSFRVDMYSSNYLEKASGYSAARHESLRKEIKVFHDSCCGCNRFRTAYIEGHGVERYHTNDSSLYAYLAEEYKVTESYYVRCEDPETFEISLSLDEMWSQFICQSR